MPQDQNFDSPPPTDSRLSVDRLQERYRGGENIFKLIRERVSDDADRLKNYWESNLVSRVNRPLPEEFTELYGIDSGDLQTFHLSDRSALNFWGGFSYVRGHMISNLQTVNEANFSVAETTIQNLLDSLPDDIKDTMAREFETLRASERLKRSGVRASLQQDPSGVTWLKSRIEEVDRADPENPLLARERSGMEAAVRGVGKLFSEITAVDTTQT